MRFDEETRHLERLEKILTERPHTAYLTKTAEAYVNKLEKAVEALQKEHEFHEERSFELDQTIKTLRREIHIKDKRFEKVRSKLLELIEYGYITSCVTDIMGVLDE